MSSDPTVRPVAGPADAELWRGVHNAVIPTAPLSLDDVLSRSRVNRLELAYDGDVLVGCSTVRPATDGDPVTVIVRILPEHRRRGLGSEYLEHVLGAARGLGADVVQTIVLETNHDGLEFAEHRGFVESERYVLDGDTVAYVHLVRALAEG